MNAVLFTHGVSPSARRDGDGPGCLDVPVICGGVVVLRPTKKVPYYEQIESEAKMRAYENIIWGDNN